MSTCTSEELLLEATPALLEGWCGPVVLHRPGSGAADDVWWYSDNIEAYRADGVRVYLDLSRAECRDRVARVVADRLGIQEPFCWSTYGGDDGPCWRLVNGSRWLAHFGAGPAPGWVRGFHWQQVLALADLNLNDDARLSDGSRLVDALGLLCVARAVLEET